MAFSPATSKSVTLTPYGLLITFFVVRTVVFFGDKYFETIASTADKDLSESPEGGGDAD